MKRIKIIVMVVLAILVLKCCYMESVCNTVDNIPVEIRDRILEEHPECVDIDKLAEYWITNGDSLVAEIAKEQELEDYWKTLPEEY